MTSHRMSFSAGLLGVLFCVAGAHASSSDIARSLYECRIDNSAHACAQVHHAPEVASTREVPASYAAYLMLNGVPEQRAIVMSRGIGQETYSVVLADRTVPELDSYEAYKRVVYGSSQTHPGRTESASRAVALVGH